MTLGGSSGCSRPNGGMFILSTLEDNVRIAPHDLGELLQKIKHPKTCDSSFYHASWG